MKYFLVFQFSIVVFINVVLTWAEHEVSAPVNIGLTKVERNCMYKPGWLTLGYKAFSMLTSAEHEIYPAHKC